MDREYHAVTVSNDKKVSRCSPSPTALLNSLKNYQKFLEKDHIARDWAIQDDLKSTRRIIKLYKSGEGVGGKKMSIKYSQSKGMQFI